MCAEIKIPVTSFYVPASAKKEAPEKKDLVAKRLGELARQTIRQLDLPYQQQTNPFAENVQELTIQWIGSFGVIVEEPEKIRKIKASKIGIFLGQCHPRAILRKLSVVADFATWLFLYDDWIENCKEKNEIQRLHARTVAILHGHKTNDSDISLAHGLHDITKRINKVCQSSLWKQRLIQDIQDYCEGTLWELANRQRHKTPSLKQYKKIRPDVSGTKVMFDFIELMEGISIPKEVFEGAYFKLMRLLGANLVNWENDILSAQKEFLSGDIHNIVFVYREQYNLSFEEAFQRATADLKSDLEQFYNLLEQVPDFGPNNVAVKKYLAGLKEWVAGHHFWAKESPRYKDFFSQE
jgi:Terpene synthase family 2, C-terminal metal binding